MTTAEPRAYEPEVIQHRTFVLERIQIRDGDGEDNASPMIRGHAAVFNEWADIVPGLLRERIAPGAFKKTIREADVRALFNHNPNYVLGRNRADTLELHEDSTGLAVKIEPPSTSWADDLLVSMKRGDVNQMSFGFRPVKWTEEKNEDGSLDVTLREATLFDVSVVTFPAYKQTDAWVRSTIATLNHYLEPEPSNHSTLGVPSTTLREPSNHSRTEPQDWQSRADLRARWLETLNFED